MLIDVENIIGHKAKPPRLQARLDALITHIPPTRRATSSTSASTPTGAAAGKAAHADVSTPALGPPNRRIGRAG